MPWPAGPYPFGRLILFIKPIFLNVSLSRMPPTETVGTPSPAGRARGWLHRQAHRHRACRPATHAAATTRERPASPYRSNKNAGGWPATLGCNTVGRESGHAGTSHAAAAQVGRRVRPGPAMPLLLNSDTLPLPLRAALSSRLAFAEHAHLDNWTRWRGRSFDHLYGKTLWIEQVTHLSNTSYIESEQN